MLDALTKRFELVHPAKAQRGDVAYIEPDKCGIVFNSGARTLGLFLGEGGFVIHKASELTHAFRVQ